MYPTYERWKYPITVVDSDGKVFIAVSDAELDYVKKEIRYHVFAPKEFNGAAWEGLSEPSDIEFLKSGYICFQIRTKDAYAYCPTKTLLRYTP